ncbi:MAG TPA: hypothetical protein VF109_06490, partial [Mycobacteriales bacterium]
MPEQDVERSPVQAGTGHTVEHPASPPEQPGSGTPRTRPAESQGVEEPGGVQEPGGDQGVQGGGSERAGSGDEEGGGDQDSSPREPGDERPGDEGDEGDQDGDGDEGGSASGADSYEGFASESDQDVTLFSRLASDGTQWMPTATAYRTDAGGYRVVHHPPSMWAAEPERFTTINASRGLHIFDPGEGRRLLWVRTTPAGPVVSSIKSLFTEEQLAAMMDGALASDDRMTMFTAGLREQDRVGFKRALLEPARRLLRRVPVPSGKSGSSSIPPGVFVHSVWEPDPRPMLERLGALGPWPGGIVAFVTPGPLPGTGPTAAAIGDALGGDPRSTGAPVLLLPIPDQIDLGTARDIDLGTARELSARRRQAVIVPVVPVRYEFRPDGSLVVRTVAPPAASASGGPPAGLKRVEPDGRVHDLPADELVLLASGREQLPPPTATQPADDPRPAAEVAGRSRTDRRGVTWTPPVDVDVDADGTVRTVHKPPSVWAADPARFDQIGNRKDLFTFGADLRGGLQVRTVAGGFVIALEGTRFTRQHLVALESPRWASADHLYAFTHPYVTRVAREEVVAALKADLREGNRVLRMPVPSGVAGVSPVPAGFVVHSVWSPLHDDVLKLLQGVAAPPSGATVIFIAVLADGRSDPSPATMAGLLRTVRERQGRIVVLPMSGKLSDSGAAQFGAFGRLPEVLRGELRYEWLPDGGLEVYVVGQTGGPRLTLPPLRPGPGGTGPAPGGLVPPPGPGLPPAVPPVERPAGIRPAPPSILVQPPEVVPPTLPVPPGPTGGAGRPSARGLTPPPPLPPSPQ